MSSGITPELRWHAIGRRKLGIARVYLTPGSGKWTVNGRTLGDYFPRPSLVSHIQQPFTATDTLGAFDVKARIVGGGLTGHGIRALPSETARQVREQLLSRFR